MERLQKYLSECGVASRRKSEELILNGRVKVNGNIIKGIVMIDPEKDIVEVDGRIISKTEHIYIMLNKPVGVITTAMDQFGRKTVLDIIGIKERIYPVGRLDYETAGLLILTNDGETANKLMHPSREIDKVYIALIDEIPAIQSIESFKKGLDIEDYRTAPAEFKILKTIGNKALVEIKIHEGRNRQVRKMCSKIGCNVLSLKREAIGELKIGNLIEGEWRYLSRDEINYLKSL